MWKFCLIVAILCILISLKIKNADTEKSKNADTEKSKNADIEKRFYSSMATNLSSPSMAENWSYSSWDWDPSMFFSMEDQEESHPIPSPSLEYDFYRDSCPRAEKIIREMVRTIYKVRSSVAPALLRLVFHDCFVEGCDASILLDAADGLKSEKDSIPNESIKGFDIIDTIKSQLEEVCPGTVSCADIVVLAAREGVVQAGGPFYPLFTGRRDSTDSFPDMATSELPSPQARLSRTLLSFASKGFDARETVCLLGSHSIGMIHCKFFQNRLHNFRGTRKPDPSLDPQFLNQMRSICNNRTISVTPAAAPSFRTSVSSLSAMQTSFGCSSDLELKPSCQGSPSPSSVMPGMEGAISAPSHFFQGVMSSSQSSSTTESVSFEGSLLSSSLEEPGINLAYGRPGVNFGGLYYRSLLKGRGILVADQQLMSGQETEYWVRTYASDVSLFRRDFARAMVRLSNLHVLTGSVGQIRLNCSKVVKED